MQARVVVADHLQVAHKDVDVGDVEARQRRVQADVCFGDVCTEEVGLVLGLGEVGFEAVEGGEDGVEGGFVGGLRGGEAGFVDAVVDCLRVC